MDPENPVVKLCTEGMAAEMSGQTAEAAVLFGQACEAASDDYERCIAAHYVARHQEGVEQTMHWNRECLRYADLVADDRVTGSYPSLYLNIGFCYEEIGDLDQAESNYRLAEARLVDVGEGPYADMVRDGVERGLERVKR